MFRYQWFNLNGKQVDKCFSFSQFATVNFYSHKHTISNIMILLMGTKFVEANFSCPMFFTHERIAILSTHRFDNYKVTKKHIDFIINQSKYANKPWVFELSNSDGTSTSISWRDTFFVNK